MRALIGRFIEWFLSYDHEVVVAVDDDYFNLPFHKYGGDAGYDLYASMDVVIPAGQVADVPSGIHLDPKSDIWLEIKARSSTLRKKGLEVVDAVIDRDYRGEMKALVHNPTGWSVTVLRGERLVQLVPHRLVPLKFKVGKMSRSSRGDSGFGSTGGHFVY